MKRVLFGGLLLHFTCVVATLGSVQVLHQQVFPDFGPPPLRQPYYHKLSPTALICWCYTWTEILLLDNLYDMFQIIKIYFSIIVRNIFWGVFKEIRA